MKKRAETCSTCGGDPKSHLSGILCVCKNGTRQGEVDGLRGLVFDRGKQIDSWEKIAGILRVALVVAKKSVLSAEPLPHQTVQIDAALEAAEYEEAYMRVKICPKKAEHGDINSSDFVRDEGGPAAGPRKLRENGQVRVYDHW